MRRAVLVTAIMLVVILMVLVEQGANVRANFIFSMSSYRLISPQSYKDRIYTTSSVNISVAVDGNKNPPTVIVEYFLDHKNYGNLSLSWTGDFDYSFFGTRTLDNLTDGYHYLSVLYLHKSITTLFLVNATGFQSPKLLLSPLNSTYTENDVPLTYAVNDSIYVVSYSLDYSNYMSITGNTTLSGLSRGQHTINIQAMNGYDLYSEQTTSFTVAPKLLLAPLEGNYSTRNVPLRCTFNDPRYFVFYSVDNSDFISVTSNTTLSDLAEGNHTVTVKATNRNGTTVYAEQTAIFNVDTTVQTLSTIFAITSGVLAAISVLAVVTYRRRKRFTRKQSF